MELSQLLRPVDLLVPFAPADKWESIARLTELAVEVGKLPVEALDLARDAVFQRERSMSTGMEHGVAIPHAALDEFEQLGAVMGIVQSEPGLFFESIDGSAAHLIVLLLIPKHEKLMHIRTLADVARGLGREVVRRKLLEAEDATTAWRVLSAKG